jgi:predicted RNA-binding protein with PIN domain
MPYLIDGHNLIGQLPDISLDDPDDEAKLVQKLIGFAARTGKGCVVVFDQGLPGGRSRMSTSKVEAVFASSRSNADRVIMERISAVKDPGQWVVVSNDNAVLFAARQRKMKALKSAEFVPLLNPPEPKRRREDDDLPRDIRLSPTEVDEWLKLFEKRQK